MKRLESLEALRGLAAMLVVFYHLQDVFSSRAGILPFGGLFGAGNRGVDLFFVLSGFIIMVTHAPDLGRPGRMLPFLYKRAARIYPIVWILTGLAALTYALHFGGAAKVEKLEAWHLVASMLLLPQEGYPLVNVTWTLTYEMLFYALFALMILDLTIGVAVLLVWQAAVALASIGSFEFSDWLADYYLRSICLEFGIGVLCALLFLRATSGLLAWRWVHFGLIAVGAGTLLGSLAYEGLSHGFVLEPVHLLVYGVAPGVLILGLALCERRHAFSVPAPLLALGAASYAIYLINYGIITASAIVLLRWTRIPIGSVALLACAAVSVAVGCAVHNGIDRPIQRRLRRLGGRLFDPPAWRLRINQASLDNKPG